MSIPLIFSVTTTSDEMWPGCHGYLHAWAWSSAIHTRPGT